jgi:hypothetical protein
MISQVIQAHQLKDLVKLADRQTQEMMARGIDISDPSVITPLEWTADRYPETAEDCNCRLTQLIQEQIQVPIQLPQNETFPEF